MGKGKSKLKAKHGQVARATSRAAGRSNGAAHDPTRRQPARGTLKPHPFADLLPPMPSGEYEALKRDIVAAGRILHDITLYEGMILDGRHRYRACRETGIRPTFDKFVGTDAQAVELVYRQSLHRNLDDSQKACAAVGIDSELARAGNLKKAQNLPTNGASAKKEPSSFLGEKSKPARDVAGERYGVSGRYVSSAKLLFSNSPRLFRSVFNGELALSRAVRRYQRDHKSRLMRKMVADAGTVCPADIDIITGECTAEAEKLPAGFARLILCDPQYNIGYSYGKKGIDDRLDDNDYLTHTRQWMTEARRLLSADGSLWTLISDEYAAEFALILKELGFTRRNWIKWYETFGVNCPNKFNRTSRHLFYCTKHPDNFVFHAEAVKRRSDREAIHNDARAVPGGKVWDDVWGVNPKIARLVDNAAERVPGFKTQLPLALLLPIVLCASDPGDRVMDFFSGSGTTAVACLQTHRRFTGFEKDPDFAERSRQRVAVAAAERKTP